METCDLNDVMEEVVATCEALDKRGEDTRTLVMCERLPRMLGCLAGRMLALSDFLRHGKITREEAADRLSGMVAK